jgi:hypothetical protein
VRSTGKVGPEPSDVKSPKHGTVDAPAGQRFSERLWAIAHELEQGNGCADVRDLWRAVMKSATRIRVMCLIGFLAAGSAIAWSTVALAFIRFYRAEGTLLKLTNCRFPNPVTTPCFYGAIAFLVALFWAASLARGTTPRAHGYDGLWWLLLASTIFGWSNVAYEFWSWNRSPTGFLVSCTTESISSPFQSPCLYGSTMFFGAWITAGLIRSAFGESA